MSVVSRWRARLRTRQALLRHALRTGNLPLIHRRADQVKQARRVIARHATKRLDPGALQHVAPWLTDAQAHELAAALGPAFARDRIVTARRAAAAVAQFAHESAGFHTTTEYATGSEYEGRRDLGNTHPGDGRRYKGRGYIQVTGRNNYAAATRAFGVDFIAHPEKLAEPRYAALVSCWWWAAHGCNELADSGNFVALTRRINGGTNGLASRQAYYARARQVAARLVPKEH